MHKICLFLALALGLSACATQETATRSHGIEGLTIATQGGPASGVWSDAPALLRPGYAVQNIDVVVPATLRVSEANSFKPVADIVWHGDPDGNRYEQVDTLLTAAARQATAGMVTGRPVNLTLTLVKFHALTAKTRATFGGVHETRFDLTVTDAATGAVIDGPRRITADIRGAGGATARAEEAVGRTQKVVITERVVAVLRDELSGPATAPAGSQRVARADAQPSGQPLLLR